MPPHCPAWHGTPGELAGYPDAYLVRWTGWWLAESWSRSPPSSAGREGTDYVAALRAGLAGVKALAARGGPALREAAYDFADRRSAAMATAGAGAGLELIDWDDTEPERQPGENHR